MRWRWFVTGDLVGEEYALECACCGECVPRDDKPWDDLMYCPDFHDCPTEDIEAFDRAFETDALADFLICRDCLKTYSPFDGPHGDPMDWLALYPKDDARLVSREEALKMLGEGENGSLTSPEPGL
jgi:hypothetical protein